MRKWYREVGHGLVTITEEQKLQFDNLSVEFADIPKNRMQLEKIVDEKTVQEEDETDDSEEKKEELVECNNDGKQTKSPGNPISETVRATLYTIKKYHSTWHYDDEGNKIHDTIEFIPLNTDGYETKVYQSGQYRTIGIFKGVINI